MNLINIRKRLRKENPRWVILLIDMMIVMACYILSNFIINSFKGDFDYERMFRKLGWVCTVYFAVFLYFKTYKGVIREAGIKDAQHILMVVFLALAILMVGTFVLRQFVDKEHVLAVYGRMSYAVVFMHAFFTLVCLVSARIFYRTIYEKIFFTYSSRKI